MAVVWFLNAAIAAGVFQNRILACGVGCALLVHALRRRRAAAWMWLVLAGACYLAGHAGVARVQADGAHAARLAAVHGDALVDLRGRVASFPQTSRFGTAFLFDTALDGRPVCVSVRAAFFDAGYGDRLVTRGRLRVSPGDARLVAREASASARIRLRDTTWSRRGGPRDGPRYVLWRWHRALRTQFTRAMSGDAALPLALLLGERGFLDPAFREAVVRLGIAHLLALSGMHLGAVAGLALFLSRASPRGRDLLLFLMLTLYAGVVGDVASLTRAYLMAALMLLARAAARPVRPLDALGKALFVMLLASPVSILSAGLQLSFAATLAVLAVALRLPLLRRSTGARTLPRRVARGLGGALVVSVVVEVVIAPLQLHHFGRISVVGPLATAAFVVPVTLLQLAALLAGATATVPAAAIPLGAFSHALSAAVMWAAARVPAPVHAGAPLAPLYYGALLLAWRHPRRPLAWALAAVVVWLSFRCA